jgi:cyclophilin family peptidyl-prolyl cis-trans isomerase
MMAQQRSTSGIKGLFHLQSWFRSRKSSPTREPSRRPQLECLEDRCVPAFSPAGTIGGALFVDPFAMGMFFPGAVKIPGISVTLSGMSNSGEVVDAVLTTDASGKFTFNSVPPGTYQVSAGPVPGLMGSVMSTTSSGSGAGSGTTVSVTGGQSQTTNLGFGGLTPQNVSLRQFLSSTSSSDFPDLLGVPGSGIFNFPLFTLPSTAPFVLLPISDVSVPINSASTRIDLAAHFSAPDISTSEVRFNTSQGPLNVTLFDAAAPQTVANIYDYINSGAYNGSVFTRNVPGFVLQGGGGTVQAAGAGTTLTSIPQGPTVPNEFGISNTIGTLALAQAGTPNSGTNQFFFNLGNNTPGNVNNLDASSFAVFGQVADAASLALLNQLASTPTHDESMTQTATNNPTLLLNSVPLINYNGTMFPSDTPLSSYLIINNVQVLSRPDFLTYSVVGNTNPGLVTPTITNENLFLNYTQNLTGAAVITIRATNAFGQFVDTSFNVKVG